MQRALYIVHDNTEDYVALLFYASWCPFSAAVKPTFSILASLFPSIAHFAIEESAVRPRFEHSLSYQCISLLISKFLVENDISFV